MRVLVSAGLGPIVPDLPSAPAPSAGTLGLPPKGDASYPEAEEIDDVKHVTLWPLTDAAQSCFDTATRPQELPVPQGWSAFDVDVIAATAADPQTGQPGQFRNLLPR